MTAITRPPRSPVRPAATRPPARRPRRRGHAPAPDAVMTREEWIAFHVARAPGITDRQWADTLLLLHGSSSDDSGSEEEAG